MKDRSPNKIQIDYTLEDIYQYYCDCHKDSELQVDKATFKKVVYAFNSKMMKAILEEAAEFQLPKRLGLIRIKKTKMSFKEGRSCKIDWHATKKYGKTIYHMNDHTNNYRYRFLWQKGYCNATNKSAYCFEATRANKRKLANILQNHVMDYYL